MPHAARFGQAPDAATIRALAEDALATLPLPFRAMLGNVIVQVHDFGEDDVLDSLGIESRYDLTGLYQGRPLTARSIDIAGELPDQIHLYRIPILSEWIEGKEELAWLVRHVLIHEIGHHFGLSDDDIDALEAEADIEGGEAAA
jgi:predicted Zn-dependent protease with MMP-like domain